MIKRITIVVAILATAWQLNAEIIDRIMAVVNGRIVTLSDLRMERRIRVVLGGDQVNDDKALARDLVDRILFEEQVAQFPGILVDDSEVEGELNKVDNLRGIPPDTLREAIRRRLTLNQFFDLRFRQLLRPTDDEVRHYYETVFLPEAGRLGLNPIPTLDQVREPVRNNVVEEKMQGAIDAWLKTLRERSDIEVFQ